MYATINIDSKSTTVFVLDEYLSTIFFLMLNSRNYSFVDTLMLLVFSVLTVLIIDKYCIHHYIREAITLDDIPVSYRNAPVGRIKLC